MGKKKKRHEYLSRDYPVLSHIYTKLSPILVELFLISAEEQALMVGSSDLTDG